MNLALPRTFSPSVPAADLLGVNSCPHAAGGGGPRVAAFTLLEVMIAGGILFICLFGVLALVANGLNNARALQRKRLDAGMAASRLAVEFTTTNQVYEGTGSGDFGDAYPGYSYDWRLEQIATNGLCELQIIVRDRQKSGKVEESKMATLLYLPNIRTTTGIR